MNIMGLFGRKYKNSKILFISSPVFLNGIESTSSDYFSFIISSLSQKIRDIKGSIDFVVKFPKIGNNYHLEQTRLLDEAIKIKDDYDCIIIALYDRDQFKEKLIDVKGLIKQDKLFLIDQGYPKVEVGDIDDEVFRPPYVQADWQQGGEEAGKSMAEYFKNKKPSGVITPNIFIVEGKIGSKERIEGFKKGLISLNDNGFSINAYFQQRNIKGEYSKETATSKFKEVLEQCLNDNKLIHGVFTCNDEMALGVRNVLEKYKDKIIKKLNETEWDLPILPKIIGFDGIKDVTTLIEQGNEFIYDTVLVDIDGQIDGLIKMINNIVIHNNKNIIDGERFISIKCGSFRKENNYGV